MSKIDVIKGYYEHHISDENEDFAVLGWESQEAQEARFSVLFRTVQLDGKKLLDVGCGLGSLFSFLRDKGVAIQYTGVDILDTMILAAQKKNPDARFISGDIFTEPLFSKGEFDVVFSSGLFNLNMGNNLDFLPAAFSRLLELAGSTVVVNMLHQRSKDQEDAYYYYHPDEVKKMTLSLLHSGESVQTVEEYLPNDFTIIIQK